VRILVVGSGGREHALVWSLARSGKHEIICLPGNPGTSSIARSLSIGLSDLEAIADLAGHHEVDLVVVGPEAPLVDGLADILRSRGIRCFGPGADGARLEGSKWFAKEIMESAGVPTAEGRVFSDTSGAMEFMSNDPADFVIKADGLAAGKGVFLPGDGDEAERILDELFSGKLGASGREVVVERRLYGREVSILAICSGRNCVLLPPSRDHKRLGEGDTGPNTGGMGAICPPPELASDFSEAIRTGIVVPVLEELYTRGIDYRGVLYAGLMITADGPKVLEFNVRFGDPETQAVLPMVRTDLAELCIAAASGEEFPESVETESGACACVVMASGGYPLSYEKGYPISGIEMVTEALVFHAGTAMSGGRLVTAGGRVLSVSAVAGDLDEALRRAYLAADRIEFEDSYYRRDIGKT
jgi:phosphoribosylamine---glycine ligase